MIARIRSFYLLPATEPMVKIALAISLVIMAGLLCAIIYQGDLIDYQRGLIRDLWRDLQHP